MSVAEAAPPATAQPRAAAVRSTRRCASCRARSATACSKSIPSAALSTTSPTTAARRRCACQHLERWRQDISALYRRQASRAAIRRISPMPVADFDLQKRGFPRRDRRHGDGCRGDIRAPDWRRSISIATGSRARSAGCRVRIFGMPEAEGTAARPSSRPRPAAHQYSARPRRGRRDRPALSAARGAAAAGITSTEPETVARPSQSRRRLRAGDRARARRISPRPPRSWRAARGRACGRRG